MDVIEASAKILSLADGGASYARIMAMTQHLRQDELRWLLKILVNSNLLMLDSSQIYGTTVDGLKFLDIQFNMERILVAQKSLV